MTDRTVLITGAAGFVGAHVAARMSSDGWSVSGIDNFNAYYDPQLKRDRVGALIPHVDIVEASFAEPETIAALIEAKAPAVVIHLGAQAGVRYSIDQPFAYASANLVGHLSVLEACRDKPGLDRLIYASSSSIYGNAAEPPFREDVPQHQPESLYAATKLADELMSECYARLYGLRQVGLRFFTVYGPWGRPDMAYWAFTEKLLAGETIPIFNDGRMRRDFTYIDDIVEGVLRVAARPATRDPDWSGDHPDPATGTGPYRLFNIGNHHPEDLMEMIRLLETELGRSARLDLLPMQPGDVPATYAEIEALGEWVGFRPSTPLAEGVRRFVTWYRAYHDV